jgi:hypothetical protein
MILSYLNKLRRTFFALFLIIAPHISSCASDFVEQERPMECIRSFQEFAYTRPDLYPEIDLVLPSEPWEIKAKIPLQEIEDYWEFEIQVAASRLVNNKSEIWLIEDLIPTDESNQLNTNNFLIYQPESQSWETVSAEIGDSGLLAGDIFVTSDGSVWGKTVWDTTYERTDLEKVPALSKFNESTRRFEFAKGVLEIPWILFSYGTFPWPEIILDKNGVFWIFAENDGIYLYDPVAQKTEKQADLLGLDVTQTALSLDGSIYFKVYSDKIYLQESFFRLLDGTLYRFIPETKEIISLKIPEDPWLVFSEMLVDQDNKLWLGAIGYREQDDTWHLIHPDPKNMFVGAGDAYQSPPFIMLESSNGILWYRKDLGDVRADGTAWYNPQTGEGCMFTNVSANVIEDTENQLWLVANEKLFKYQLTP